MAAPSKLPSVRSQQAIRLSFLSMIPVSVYPMTNRAEFSDALNAPITPGNVKSKVRVLASISVVNWSSATAAVSGSILPKGKVQLFISCCLCIAKTKKPDVELYRSGKECLASVLLSHLTHEVMADCRVVRVG